MGRSLCCAKEGLNRGAWTALEDKILANYIKVHGEGRWRILPKKAGLKRCGKSCRLRWLNYLRPDIKRGNISTDEEELIIRLHKLLGNRWSLIAGRLPGRTDNEIKNYWNTNLGKRVQADHQSLARRQPNKPQGKYVSHDTKPPQLDSHVVRTKAIKCSKVVLGPPLSHSHKFQHYFNYYHTGTETVSPLMGVQAPAPNDNIKPVMEHHSSSSARDGLSLGEPPVDNWQDFVMDFDVGELCFSGLLNSEFADLCNFEINNELSPPTNYIPSLMPQPEETLPADWSTVTDCGVQVGHPSYPSFPNNSIPDSRGHLLME